MRQAKDIMTRDPKVFQSGEVLRDALAKFLHSNVHSAPVVNPVGEVLGMLTEMSLVRASVRQLLNSGASDKTDKIAHHADILEEVSFIEEDLGIEEVIRALVKAPTHRLLVMSKQKRLVGIISPRDILRFVTGISKDTEDLRKQLEEAKGKAEKLAVELTSVKSTLERYRTMFEDIPNMMHSLDGNGMIVMANKKIHEILGYGNGELLGKSYSDIYPKSVQHLAIEGLNKIKDQGIHHAVYSSMQKKNGDKLRVEVASSSLRDSKGAFISTISISREVNSEALLRALHGMIEVKRIA